MALRCLDRLRRSVKHFATRGNIRCLSHVPVDDVLYGLNHDQSEVPTWSVCARVYVYVCARVYIRVCACACVSVACVLFVEGVAEVWQHCWCPAVVCVVEC